MKKKITLGLISTILSFSIAFTVGMSIHHEGNTNIQETEAAVGSYSRDQSTYYTSAFSHKVTSSSYGTSLLTTLHELMYDSHATYNSYDELWTYTVESDYDIDNPDNIILLYSRQSVNGAKNDNVWNREHVWCQSHAFYTTGTGAGSDLHHLRPASTNYNSTRSNTPYGVVASHSESNRMGDTDCYYTSNYFEPADYIKGDVARILMYMYTHYSSSVSGTSTYSGTLNITDIVTTSSGTAQAAWDLLMDWNESDPVDYREMIRNNKCAYLLGNYNPFIDHPEFARMIWDDSTSQQAGLFFQSSYKTVNVGSTYTNTASKYGNVNTSGTVYYSSDNPSIATVSSSGVVTGVSNGVARIKARCTINGVSKISYHFVVVGSGYTPKHTLNASGVVYTPTSKTTAVASETLGSETVTYSNSYGTSQLTNGKSLTLTINNFPKTISSLKLYMKSNGSAGSGTVTVTVGGSSYYSRTGTFAQIYGSYSTSFVPVDVTNASASKKTGTIVISISATVNSLYFQKAVIDYSERTITKATAVSVSPSSLSLTPGEDTMLDTLFTPSSTTLQTVTWSSNNTSVATVNKYGLVKAVAKGNATITATSADGSNKSGSMSLSVVDSVTGDSTETTLTSITLNTSNVQKAFTVGDTFNYTGLVVTAHYSDSTSQIINSGYIVTAPNLSTAGNKAVTVTYEGQSSSYNITVSSAAVTGISASVSKTYHVGDTISASDISVEDSNGDAVNNFTFANDGYQFTYADAASGGASTNKTFTNAISYSSFSCSLTVSVSREAYTSAGSSYTDTMTQSWTGVSGTQYVTWSGKTLSSGVVYAGNSAASNSTIQLRTTNNNSGIVATANPDSLNISSISVTFRVAASGGTADGRTLQFYGKNTAYSATTDLYNNNSSTKGTLLGSITKSSTVSSGTVNVTGNYKFIGIRSSDGALYANEIVVTYGTPETASNVSNFIMYEDTNNQCTTKLSQAITKLNNMSTSEKTTFNTSNDYVILTARTRLEAWARNQGKTLTYSDTDGTFSASTKVVNSLIASNVNNNITPIIIVVSLIAISSVGGYFFLRHKKER